MQFKKLWVVIGVIPAAAGCYAYAPLETSARVQAGEHVAVVITDRGRAESCLDAYASSPFTADWGVRIVGTDNAMFNPTGYHYGSVWPLFTGWTALAEFASHRPLQGFLHTVSTMTVYRHWGAGYVEEVLNGETFEPAGVCSHKAWSENAWCFNRCWKECWACAPTRRQTGSV